MADLKSFMQSQMAQQEALQRVDWTKRKDKWLAELDRLFSFIRKSLSEVGLPQEHLIAVSHSLYEDALGAYSAPGLAVNLPAAGRIDFTPVGSVIIGGYGRVDVTGPNRERVKLIADDAIEDRPESDETPSYEREWVWRVHPGVGFRDSFSLNDDGLARLLAIVTGSK